MAYAPGNHTGPNRPDKGQQGGSCNVTACQLPQSAWWFNHSTRAYYCETCAAELNRVNSDFPKMFSVDHQLCTNDKELKDVIAEVDGTKWLVRFATSIRAAENEIAFARCTGSIGGSTTVNGNLVSDVVRLNEDGSEATPS